MADPQRPGQIPHDVGLVTLAQRQQEHRTALFDHRYGIEHLSDAQRAGHALAEMAYSTALSERALYGRWVVACEALDAGATHQQVATALGLDVEELRVGLRSWARSQHRLGLIDDTRHAEVLALSDTGRGAGS